MSLASEWRKRLGERHPEKRVDRTEGLDAERRAWAEEIIAKIPAYIENTVDRGGLVIDVGDFRYMEWPAGKGNFFPTRDELKGAALMLFDFCQDEGLHLFISGTREHGYRWIPPFGIFIRLER
ncbi:MAG: hypothetical protein WC641_03195 [Patescibacteria group bacterium]